MSDALLGAKRYDVGTAASGLLTCGTCGGRQNVVAACGRGHRQMDCSTCTTPRRCTECTLPLQRPASSSSRHGR